MSAVIGDADVAAMGAEVGRMLGGMALVEIVRALRPGRGSSEELASRSGRLPGLLSPALKASAPWRRKDLSDFASECEPRARQAHEDAYISAQALELGRRVAEDSAAPGLPRRGSNDGSLRYPDHLHPTPQASLDKGVRLLRDGDRERGDALKQNHERDLEAV